MSDSRPNQALFAPQDWWFTTTVLVAPILAGVLFYAGWVAMDQSEPNQLVSGSMYVLATGVAVAAMSLIVIMHRDQMDTIGLNGGIGGLVAGGLLAAVAEDSYAGGYFSRFTISLVDVLSLLALPILTIGFLATIIVLARQQGFDGLTLAITIWGFLGATAIGVASLYHLATLPRQARIAEAAHSAPSLSLALLLVGLLGSIAWTRRLQNQR